MIQPGRLPQPMAQFDPEVDYYEVLQVHPRAHQEVIKRAYRTIVKLLQMHPDLGGRHEDAVLVNQAYEVLSDPDLRQAYDLARQNRSTRQTAPPSPAPPPPAQPPPAPAPSPKPPSSTFETPLRRDAYGAQTCYCPRCGARNRLPSFVDLQQAVCGKCRAPLLRTQVAGRDMELPIGDMQLPAVMVDQLTARSELRLKRVQVPSNGRLHCLRCHIEWEAPVGAPPPRACPHCRSQRWSDFRVFRCRYCGHQFLSAALLTLGHFPLWPWPYWLFPECPACRKRGWNVRCERHTFKEVLNLLRWVLGKNG